MKYIITSNYTTFSDSLYLNKIMHIILYKVNRCVCFRQLLIDTLVNGHSNIDIYFF